MEIPITISIKGNTAELARDLFGLGEKVTDPEIIGLLGEDARHINESTTISDGITLGQPSIKRFYKVKESVQTGWQELDVALFFTEQALNLGIHVYTITDWILGKIQKHDYKITLDNKEVKKDEFQKTLDEYIKSHSTKK